MKTFKINKPKTQSFNPKNIKSLTDFSSSVEPNKVNGKTLKTIPLDQIDAKPQVRTVMENIGELAESMKSGQLLPISVAKSENGNYVILQGERRWLAAKQAGLSEIEAIVVEAPKNEADRIFGQLTENIQRENMKLCDLVSSISDLVQLGHNQTEIAKRLGKDRTYISRIASLASAHPLVKQFINDSFINDPQTAQIVNSIFEKSANAERLLASCRDEDGCISRPAAQRLLNSLNASKESHEKKQKVKSYEDRLKKKEIPNGIRRVPSAAPVNIAVSFLSESGHLINGHLLPRLIAKNPNEVCVLCEKDHKVVSVPADKIILQSISELQK
ncbi:ParB/RepB/Spo0J family partition protein [Parasutterella muris]|uniref:ParB/RepB/Spo0J family partition protein n=2 Tax=Parasutterella TaxID=577310 RepID=A0A6L6YJM1_9BURK|nr:ParB/RepB/Spo0J family partition protein [Parasutterella muris]MVX57925.1 ParB/RepB/Spo0J family partition protein [Parasutterella muris]